MRVCILEKNKYIFTIKYINLEMNITEIIKDPYILHENVKDDKNVIINSNSDTIFTNVIKYELLLENE
jgi:hypothetical protein